MQQKIYSNLNNGKLTEKDYLINLKKIEIKDKEYYIDKLKNLGRDTSVRKQKKELKKLKEELKA